MSQANNESDTLFSILRERYGDRLSDDQFEEVRKGVEQIAEAAQSLRAVPLENGDEPFALFQPYRKED
jgi:hypothetical protein